MRLVVGGGISVLGIFCVWKGLRECCEGGHVIYLTPMACFMRFVRCAEFDVDLCKKEITASIHSFSEGGSVIFFPKSLKSRL